MSYDAVVELIDSVQRSYLLTSLSLVCTNNTSLFSFACRHIYCRNTLPVDIAQIESLTFKEKLNNLTFSTYLFI